MKTFKDYILEANAKEELKKNDVEQSSSAEGKTTTTTTTAAPAEEIPEQMDFEFNFSDLIDETEKKLEKLQEIASECNVNITNNDGVISITLVKANIKNIDPLVSLVKDYVDAMYNSSKYNSSDSFGNVVRKNINNVDNMDKYIDSCKE